MTAQGPVQQGEPWPVHNHPIGPEPSAWPNSVDRRIADLEAAIEKQDRDHGRALLYLTAAWAATLLVILFLALMLEDRLGALRSEMIGLLS